MNLTLEQKQAICDALESGEQIFTVCFDPTGEPEPLTWDAVEKSVDTTIDVDGLTASTNDWDDWSKAVGVNPLSTGLRVFAIDAIFDSAGDTGSVEVGVCNNTQDGTERFQRIGETANSWGMVWYDGAKAHNGVSTAGFMPVFGSGDSPMVAVNFTTGKMWFGTVANGWTGDPAADTGQAYSFAPNTPLRPMVVMYANPAGPFAYATLATTAVQLSALAVPIPNGFTEWAEPAVYAPDEPVGLVEVFRSESTDLVELLYASDSVPGLE